MKFVLKTFGLAVFVLAVTSLAQAQAPRTWVSGVGDDANPCSRTAPCKTFAGAISKTATDGEIDCLDPGGFGAVTITKSITIEGGGTFGSILATGTTGIIVNVTSATDTRKTVRLRNLSINGDATGINGINFIAGKKLYVENCVITGFQGSSTSRGIVAALATPGQLYVSNSLVSNCASGIDTSSSTPALLVAVDDTRLEGMTDAFIMQAGTGGTLRNSFITGNSGIGVKLSGTAGLTIENTVINSNGTGIQPGAGTTTDLSNTSIIGNGLGIATTGGTVNGHGNNRISLNTSPGAAPGNVGQQ